MTPMRKTIGHGSLQRLLEAGASIDVEVIGGIGGWGVTVAYGCVRQTLAVMRGDARTFRKFETLVHYLDHLGIALFRVDATAYRPQPLGMQSDLRRRQASDRMKRAHAAAAVERRIQASVEETSPGAQEVEPPLVISRSVT